MAQRVIWKFPVNIRGNGVSITAPRGLKPLHIAVDPKTGATCIWALVDLDANQVMHLLRVYATGELLQPTTIATDFVGTVIRDDGKVWHYFLEVKP